MDNEKLMLEYLAAYFAVHGHSARISQMANNRFDVETRAGHHAGYTVKDIKNLTRGLVALAGRQP